jgi:hypothetical protein
LGFLLLLLGLGEIRCVVGEKFHEKGRCQESQLIVNLEPVKDRSVHGLDTDDVDDQYHPCHLCDDDLKPLPGAKEGYSNS